MRAQVGKGCYGLVFMVTEREAGRCLAVKRMSKQLLIEKNQVDVLCCAVLCCAVLCCAVLCCAVLLRCCAVCVRTRTQMHLRPAVPQVLTIMTEALVMKGKWFAT